LRGAKGEGVKVSKMAVFSGLYLYTVLPFLTEDNQKIIKMGCFTRTLEEWEKDFWNNNGEFPNDGSVKSELRKSAFECAKRWIEINSKND
jgi:hypothetical protein